MMQTEHTLAATCKSATAKLQQAKITSSPRVDAELLLCHVLAKPKVYLYSHPEYQLTSSQQQQFNNLLQRRLTGEPIAYIVGEKEFWSLLFKVTPATLIPRADTECLVEQVLALLNQQTEQPLQIADLGTGSGAIAIALASECPAWQLYASDKSAAALEVAIYNSEQLQTPNVKFLQANWLECFAKHSLDAVVANPPYIAQLDPHLLVKDLSYEPQTALVAADDGLADIKIIAEQAVQSLKPNAWLCLEHGYDQANAVKEILRQHGFNNIRCHRDLHGVTRVTIAQKT